MFIIFGIFFVIEITIMLSNYNIMCIVNILYFDRLKKYILVSFKYDNFTKNTDILIIFQDTVL